MAEPTLDCPLWKAMRQADSSSASDYHGGMNQPKFSVTTYFNKDMILQRVTDPTGQVVEQMIRLQDLSVRKALIDLGWTPPSDHVEAGE